MFSLLNLIFLKDVILLTNVKKYILGVSYWIVKLLAWSRPQWSLAVRGVACCSKVSSESIINVGLD